MKRSRHDVKSVMTMKMTMMIIRMITMILKVGKKLWERIEDLLEVKMNMKRKILLKRVVRQKGSSSNAPPLIVTFEDQVSAIRYGQCRMIRTVQYDT